MSVVVIGGGWFVCPFCKNSFPMEKAKKGPDGVRYCPTCHKKLLKKEEEKK